MACCMVGLLLVYQLIDGWRRVRDWCAQPVGARVGALHQFGWLTFGIFALGFGGTLLVMHRAHLQHEASTLAAAAAQMCRSIL